MPALLFGSISTLADTSEIQRDAFNRAFAQHDLDWTWSRADYVRMLESSGGRQRVADEAARLGVDVDADAVHRTKSTLFQESLTASALAPRPGVVEAITAARAAGVRVGLVTTTSAANVDALLAGLARDVDRSVFDVIVDASAVDDPKPDPAAYRHALAELGEAPEDAVAIEDNVGGTESASAAGVRCIAFPNANTEGHDFPAAAQRTTRLDPAALVGGLTGRAAR
jgi:HAD superfamily hydrolase (TIGR01509 family)